MSIARYLHTVPQLNYAALHSGSGMFMPERAMVNKAVTSLSTKTIHTSVGPNVTALQDPFPGSFSASAASHIHALILEAKNLQQEVESAKLTCQQWDEEHKVLCASQVAFSPSEDSQLDALTLEASKRDSSGATSSTAAPKGAWGSVRCYVCLATRQFRCWFTMPRGEGNSRSISGSQRP